MIRQRPPKCLKLSAGRPSICRQCCKRSLNQLRGYATPIWAPSPGKKMGYFFELKPTFFQPSLWTTLELFRLYLIEARRLGGRCWRVSPFTFRTSKQTASTPLPKDNNWAVSVPSSASPCCAKVYRLG